MFYQQAQSPAADRGHQINKLFLSLCLCQITNIISDFTLDKHETLSGARSSGGGRRRRPLLSWGREEREEPALCLQPVSGPHDRAGAQPLLLQEPVQVRRLPGGAHLRLAHHLARGAARRSRQGEDLGRE